MAQKLVYDGLQSCPYLDGQVARMPLYRQLDKLGLGQADHRFAQAERRVGVCLYHTACPTCRACEGIRIPVATFTPTKSQRRTKRRGDAAFRVEYGRATYTDAKLALFNKHKQHRGLNSGDDDTVTPLGYTSWLVHSCMHTMEMRYYLDEQLAGVGVLDLGRTAASSVYFYFDPDPEVARLSPGVYSVLRELDLCARTRRDHLYLGLYVRDCRHLSYKASYTPHERLVDGDWRLRAPEPA
ncbi:MAG: arginyl-tRNA--protein-N-Asp/Glu arginylyltransferase [Myxococcota bacterium]|jgi:arginyl-tRNA--protein-N-Asp/Glu arginylyltransferase